VAFVVGSDYAGVRDKPGPVEPTQPTTTVPSKSPTTTIPGC